MEPTTEAIIVPRTSAAQLTLHARLAAHHAAAGTDRPDIRAVYGNLQEASQQRHLPAFQ